MTEQHTKTGIGNELLDQLFSRMGIERDFYDYLGVRHVSSPEVRCQLVEAMGYVLQTEEDAKALLQQLDWLPWLQGIPPVAVLHEGWEKAIEIHIPEAKHAMQARWQIRCEQGQVLEGNFIADREVFLAAAVVEGRSLHRYRLRLPDNIPTGYHKLTLRFAQTSRLADRICYLIVAPARCFQPPVLASEKRMWGLSVQLYSLRSDRNWGIGDYKDLYRLVEYAAKAKMDFIGLNPLHALFPANPDHISPYSPSSRLFQNYLYLDIDTIIEYMSCEEVKQWLAANEVQQQLKSLREKEIVDYPAVASLKLTALRMLFCHFRNVELKKNTPYASRFIAYVEQQGDTLLRQAIYDALFTQQVMQLGWPAGWQNWPAEFRDPKSGAVQKFYEKNKEEVQFYQYLQWLCAEQLKTVQRAARTAGMRIGLYRDLAVGFDPGGAEAWSEQNSYSFLASVGAPPDPLALHGQDWGLPPLNPRALQLNRYEAFIKLIRANMQYSGALRIDHVMALMRLWWMPSGGKAEQGAYVHYPLDDLLGILALESERNGCMVIGEDLGTVPDQIRQKLPATGVYSYKVMYFEKQFDNRFKSPDQYEHQAMATVSTHDLPTLAGWWEGVDLELRDKLGLFPSTEIREREYQARVHDRQALLNSLSDAGLLPESVGSDPNQCKLMTVELSAAVHCLLAKSRAALMVVQPEDVLLMRNQVNLPGTANQYPNWQRKLTKNSADWIMDVEAARLFEKIRTYRS
ncbi:MAG: 4-alpha-glucanotransferase [Gammaproteobacteria bacterium]|nr:4-alpha-glucanotransferase [Gammaproteobacteria bacterium]